MAETAQKPDPFGNYNFLVEIQGITRAGFKEVSGLESAIDVTEYREGGENTTLRKLPGLTKFTNITCKFGMTDDHDMYDWHRNVVRGIVDRRNGSIIILNRQREPVARWNFDRALPIKWTGPSFNAEATEVAIETFELAHEGLVRA